MNFYPRVFVRLLIVTLVLVANPVHAHLMNTGFGPFYDGLAHLFVTPEDLLPVLALALLAGLRGPPAGRAVLFALPLAWLAGSCAGQLFAPSVPLTIAVAVLTITLGALTAADRALPLALVVGLAIALGLINGGGNGMELGKLHASVLAAVGVSAALFVVVALLAGQVAKVRAAWARVGVRVAGSWIAAAGLLMLGWALRAR
jgi:hydrogenase/urease accessory protein HupE